jgi:hypothetical protein
VSTFVRLVFVICASAITPVFAGGPAPEPEQPASQSSAPAASNTAAQPAAAASDKNASTAAPATSSTENTAPTQTPNATAGASSSSATKVVLVDKTMTDAQVKQLLAKGYRPQGQGDGVLYCRREPILGSHFEQKICRSAEEIMRDEQDAKEMTGRMQQPMGSPAGK